MARARATPTASLEGLAVGYRLGRRPREVLSGIDATLDGGELVCLLGSNGIGKSTLLRTVAGLQAPLAGRVLIEGHEVTSFAPRERARRIAVVLTEPLRVGLLRVEDLVSLGRYPHTDWAGRLGATDRERVRWALELVGATDLSGRPVSELSDGERQKVMIARALAQDAALLVLDEPTAFLDLTRRVEVIAILRRLARETGRTLLVATHDLDLALRGADRLWLLQRDGNLDVGAPEDLVLAGAIARLFADSEARFDPESGAVRLPVEERGRVRLVGPPGAEREWTARALEREGLRVVDDPEAELVVEVSSGEEGTAWRTQRRGKTGRHPNIYDLLRRLRELAGNGRNEP